jgi:hypothetical protein
MNFFFLLGLESYRFVGRQATIVSETRTISIIRDVDKYSIFLRNAGIQAKEQHCHRHSCENLKCHKMNRCRKEQFLFLNLHLFSHQMLWNAFSSTTISYEFHAFSICSMFCANRYLAREAIMEIVQ